MSRREPWSARALGRGAVAVFLLGVLAVFFNRAIIWYSPAEADMSSKSNLKWEFADGRKPERFIVARLDRIEKESGGIFGLRRSPSFADSLPDARILEGTATGPGAGGGAVSLRLPGPEVPSVRKGDRVAFGIVGANTCICVLAPPANVKDEQLPDWLSKQDCGPAR